MAPHRLGPEFSRGARVYEVHSLRWPSRHGEMRILAFLTDSGVVRPILRHLRIPEHPPYAGCAA